MVAHFDLNLKYAVRVSINFRANRVVASDITKGKILVALSNS